MFFTYSDIESMFYQNEGDVYSDFTLIKREIKYRDKNHTIERMIFVNEGRFYEVEFDYEIKSITPHSHTSCENELIETKVLSLKEKMVIIYESV